MKLTEPRPNLFAALLAALVTLPAATLAGGCATYADRTRAAFRDFQEGHFAESMAAYGDADVTGSEFLAGAEAGVVALTAGDWERARTHLHRAADAAGDVEGRGALEAGKLAETITSWGLNDTTKAYGGEGFERVYVHSLLALAYLAHNLLDDVGVEVRLANRILETEEELYEKEYRAGGLGHLISAVAYELRGELDQAYIDYARMEAKGVGTEIAGRALVRIAHELGRADELERWTERYGPVAERPPGAATIVVIAGVGLAPYKVEGRLFVPTGDGIIPMAVPSYEVRPQPVDRLRLVASETDAAVVTDVVEHVSDVASENLQDRLAWVAAKSVARGVLKRELTKHLEDEAGVGGRLVGDLFAVITERADLRSWRTLPDSWQAARLFVPPGRHTLTLEALGGQAALLGTFELDPGETMIVLARTVNTKLYAYPIGGRLVRDPTIDEGAEAAPMAP